MHHQRKLTQLLYDSISKIEDLLLPHKSALKVASTLNSFLDVANEAKNPTESHFHAILWLDTGRYDYDYDYYYYYYYLYCYYCYCFCYLLLRFINILLLFYYCCFCYYYYYIIVDCMYHLHS